MTPVVVTGGAGFIGRWLVQGLVDRGDEVWILDDLSSGRRENLDGIEGDGRIADVVEGRVQDEDTVRSLFDRAEPATCFHLAAQGNVQVSLDEPRRTFEANVVGTQIVADACRAHDAKLVFMSTCLVYDRVEDGVGIREEHPLKAESPYAASKIAGEALVEGYHHGYGLPVVTLRPFNVYGPHQRDDAEGGVIAIFARRVQEGLPLKVYGEGTQTRDFLYVEDCVEFMLAAAEDPDVEGEVLNAGTGVEVSINDLAKRMAGDRVPVEHVPHHHPQSEIQRLFCDPGRANRVLDWKPRTPLDEGLERVLAWEADRHGGG